MLGGEYIIEANEIPENSYELGCERTTTRNNEASKLSVQRLESRTTEKIRVLNFLASQVKHSRRDRL